MPRCDDEFSYLLMSNTFASGRLANPTPPLPEFFETFHVLVRPTYISKYYPAQGVFLAAGEKLTRHPAVGVWLGSALACAAVCWMLQAWVGPVWGLVGGFLVMVEWGVYSYWSQSYWGGMVAAFGGALFFGALRRLWDRLSWGNALGLGAGMAILANSRPLEGALAVGIAGSFFLWRLWRNGQWATSAFWRELVIPAGAVLLLGVAAMGAYDRATTGAVFVAPYVLHERQYQETPPFIFLRERPKIAYSSEMLRKYYENDEWLRYTTLRRFFPCGVAQILRDWWYFYCGILFSLPLLIPVLMRRGWICWLQLAVLAGIFLLPEGAFQGTVWQGCIADVLLAVQVGLLWLVFDGLWPRLAIVLIAALLLLGFVCKWWFSHYSAPVACLIWLLQVEGLRRIWHWRSAAIAGKESSRGRPRSQPVRRSGALTLAIGLRCLVCLFPVVCVLFLIPRLAFRMRGGVDIHTGTDWQQLITDPREWSLQRLELSRWLEAQPTPQLVLVRYSPSHNDYLEWVYNDANLPHSKVIWARDLGTEHNRLLLRQMPERKVWILEADLPRPQLEDYVDPMR